MGKRRKSRSAALQLLYQHDRVPDDLSTIFATFWESREPEGEDVIMFAEELVTGVVGNMEPIDGMIEKYSEHWSPERMALIDRMILRLAVYELLFLPKIPPKVTINEYIEISKKYSTGESGAFINGILDRIRAEEAVGTS